jgi:hypothetical protein
MQKTIVAGMAPAIPMGVPAGTPGMQQMQQPGGYGQPGGAPNAGGANKTVMLASTDGIVSVARQQPGAAPAGVSTGASTTFWIVSLLMGVAIGALAYVIVLQLS